MPLHASIVHSTIANGRTVSIDTSAAEKAPGVLAVFTHRNMPRMNPTPKPWSHLHPHGQCYLPLQDDQIHYAGQPIALVVAETLDQAAHAGDADQGRVRGAAARSCSVRRRRRMPSIRRNSCGRSHRRSAMPTRESRSAAVRIEQTYTTSDRHHNQMEPHATTASLGR